MFRQMKQQLAMAARAMANESSFVSLSLLFNKNIDECSQDEFLEIVANIQEIMEKKPSDEREKYIEQVYKRMLNFLSRKVLINENEMNKVVKEYAVYFPSMSILTLDDLKQFGLQMERRSLIIHFDMSGSMAVSGFSSLVSNIVGLCNQFRQNGIQICFSLFGGDVQETVHRNIANRLLTLDEFIQGNYKPTGGTAFCPSFERTKNISYPYDSVIISDGEFTDNISQLTFQDKCKTVFFVAPPWSPSGIEQKHAQSISSCVNSNVPYIGINSQQYDQLYQIIEQYLIEHHSFVCLNQYTSIGNYVIPNALLAPTQFIQLFQNSLFQNETILENFVKKLLGLFRYLEETGKLNFLRCLQSNEFQSLMSLIVPLIKICYSNLEKSQSYQLLYGYLTKILNYFANEKRKLIEHLVGDEKTKCEVNQFWDNAMNFNERSLIIEENNKNYGQSIGYFNVHVDRLECSIEILSESLQQIKTIHAPENLDYLSLIIDLLCSSELSHQAIFNDEQLNIPIWNKTDGTIDLISMLRLLPTCLQQFQQIKRVNLDNQWTFQPTVALRLSWILLASNRTLPSFIANALPSLMNPNPFLTDLDLDENRSTFWLKILRQLSSQINLSQQTLQSIEQILTAYVLKGFLNQLTDDSVTFEKQIYENVSPFIDTDDSKAWCIFVDHNGNRLDPSTGQILQATSIITNAQEIQRYYSLNVVMHGSVVRPRYLTLLEYTTLPEGAIELYQSAKKKDTDILRDQLDQIFQQTLSSDQFNAHIYTIRNQIKAIPHVLWNQTEQINETVIKCKAACLNAVIPTENVTINITRSNSIQYLIQHSDDTFIARALTALVEYPRVAKEQSSNGIKEIDYAIQYGQNIDQTIALQTTTSFHHLDKPVVQEYFQKLQNKFNRFLRSIRSPPQFSSLSTLFKQVQSQSVANQILGFNNLESIPERTSNSQNNKPMPILDKQLFTCPITLDIMDNPATTTPCGHVFELDAIQLYTNRPCPICRTVITAITPNYAFKNVIQAWLDQHKQSI